jgi:hypothetical protein
MTRIDSSGPAAAHAGPRRAGVRLDSTGGRIAVGVWQVLWVVVLLLAFREMPHLRRVHDEVSLTHLGIALATLPWAGMMMIPLVLSGIHRHPRLRTALSVMIVAVLCFGAWNAVRFLHADRTEATHDARVTGAPESWRTRRSPVIDRRWMPG